MNPILGRRLLFVSGKGGVGKTTVAAAMAQWAFRRRKHVLVVELSPWGRLRELLGGPAPGPEPREIQPRLEIVRIDPREALEDFLRGVLPFRALRQRLLQSSSFSILTAAAPGIEEFLLLAKIVAFEQRQKGLRRRPAYDLIVVDAPSTGHSIPFLSTARTLMEMLPVGPLARTAEEIGRVIGDARRTAAVIVTIPEEMAVNETLEISEGLRRSGAISVGPVIVNAVWPGRFDEEQARWLTGPQADPAHPLVAAGRYHLERRLRAEEHVARLSAELGSEPVQFPFLMNAGTDRASMRKLVAALEGGAPEAAS